jgi:hypothetical protein
MQTGQVLDCNDCEDRKQQLGYYCDFCPNVRDVSLDRPYWKKSLLKSDRNPRRRGVRKMIRLCCCEEDQNP